MFVITGSFCFLFLIHVLRCDDYVEMFTQYVQVAGLEVVVFLTVSLPEIHSMVT